MRYCTTPNRGSQRTGKQFQKLLADHGVICSMSRSANVWDNAAMESFFSSLKTERTARKTYRTRDGAKAFVRRPGRHPSFIEKTPRNASGSAGETPDRTERESLLRMAAQWYRLAY
jgi:transposase InsO family protein